SCPGAPRRSPSRAPRTRGCGPSACTCNVARGPSLRGRRAKEVYSSALQSCELRRGGLVRAAEDLVDRQVAQLLAEHLDAPRAGVAHVLRDLDVAVWPELALARELAVVDGLLDQVGQALAHAVAELEPGEPVDRDDPQVLGLDVELAQVPGVDGDA